MKKVLVISFLLCFNFAFAGTGGANDLIVLYLAIIAFMSIILVVLYSINFFKKIIKERNEKKIAQPEEKDQEENPA